MEILTSEDLLYENEKGKVVESIIGSQFSDEEKSKITGKLDQTKSDFIVKHLGDKEWRINNLYYIVDEDGDKIPFKPNFIQREILTALFRGDDGYIRHIILKYRQGGVSTLFTIVLLDEFLWGGRNIYNVIIAHERKLLVSLFKKIRFALETMDTEFKVFIPKMDSDNANELFITKTNNRLGVSLDTRGETPTRIHITELAWREFAKQASLLLAVNPLRKCKITIESTANGVGDPFYNLTMKARTGEGTYKLLFYPWYIEKRNITPVPFGYGLNDEEIIEARKTGGKHYRINYTDKELQIKKQFELSDEQLYWRRTQIADAMAMGEDGNKKFDQENPDSIDTAFVASGSQVFDLSLDYKINKPIFEKGEFKIFGPPEDAMVFGIDTAEGGKNSDYSTIVGMNRAGKVLISFRKRCEDFELAEAMDQILSMKYLDRYFVGTILIERNKGTSLVSECRKYDWFYLVLKGRDQTAINDKTKEYYGFWTGGGSKEQLIRDFRKGIFNHGLEITEQIHNEICTYIYNNGKAEAMSGMHDDMIMAAMIAYHGVLFEPWIETYKNVKIERKFKNPLEKFDNAIMSGNYEGNEYSEWEDEE